MNTEHLSRGWALIAEGAQYLSMAYASNEPPLSGGVPASLPAETPEAGAPPSSVSGPSFDELPPTGYEGPTDQIPMKPQVDAGLGKCPTHGLSWTIKAGGISKNGKAYPAFWKCAEKDGDAFCNEKPQKIWADTHPAERAA